MNFKNPIRMACTRALITVSFLSLLLASSCQKDSELTPSDAAGTSAVRPEVSTKGPVKLATTTQTFLGVPITSSSVISLYKKSNVTISGLTISGGSAPCIQLTQCTNVHITKCKLQNTTNYGILIGSGCSNILIDSCYISNVATGVLAVTCPDGQIRINANQFLNMKGPFPKGSYIQFSGVGGRYNRIQNNICENTQGYSNPEDGISIYKSNGIAGDPICVVSNTLRGGGPSTTGSGITVGDGGGSYIFAAYNTVVNSGYMGMQVAGGHDVQLYANNITSSAFSWSHQGLGCGNYSGQSSYNITINGNKVKWISGKSSDQIRGSKSIERDASYQVGTSMPGGWTSNILGAGISPTSVVPSTLITWQ